MLLDKQGVDVNQAMNNGVTPLYIASSNGHAEVVSMLLAKQGVNANQADNRGVTPIMVASQEGHAEVVPMLLGKQGVDVNQAANNGWTPLYIASRNGNAKVVKKLLANQRVEVNQATEHGVTPLWIASYKGHAEVVALLVMLKRGKILVDSCETRYKKTPLMAACMKGSKTIVDLLLRLGPNVDLKDKTGETALGIACKKENDELVKLLFGAGASFPDDPSKEMEKVLVRVIGLDYVKSIGKSRAEKFHRLEGPTWWEKVQCAICHEPLSPGCWHTRRCGHSFHDKCITDWYDIKNGNENALACPICRGQGVCFGERSKIPLVQETYRNLRL